MAKYQKYAEYKDSGVEWLGAIPGHWGVTQLKRLGKFITGMTPSTAVEAYYSDEITEYGWIRPEDILEESEKVEPTKFLTKLGWETQRTIPAQSTLICCIGTIGKLGFLGKRAVTNQQITALVPNVRGFSKYYYYLLTASRNQLEHLATGNVVKILNSERLGSLWLPLLSSQNEARQIVHFLDHETAKIDSLITKQEKLIELLKEKRQAVISHAVTKGLNPDVNMKDSGVEWLGEVPEHWRVIKFNHVVQIRNGLVDPRDEKFKNLVLYAPNHIEKATGKILYKETAEEQGADSNKYLCFKGEVIYSKIRPALAKVAICEEATALCSADMYPMDSYNGLTNQFLYYFILSDSFTEAVILDSDRVAMPKINRESLSDYKLPIPPINEQLKIIDFIEMTGKKLDCLETKAAQAIQLMLERRTALISAAVTGKIDVRHWQHPNQKNNNNTELSA